MEASVRARERRLWRLAGGYLAAVYLLLYPFQFVLDALRSRGWLYAAVGATFVAAGLGAAAFGIRARWRPAQWAVAAAAALVVAWLASRLDVVQERLHLVEYGLLALLLRAALRLRLAAGGGRAATWLAAGAAIVAAGAAGWIDEGIQAVLPNRYYDIRDVGFNAGAGALAVVFAELHAAVADRPDAPVAEKETA